MATPLGDAADHPLARRISAVLDLDPDAPAIEFDGQWHTWGEIGHLARSIATLSSTRVGILLRNRPVHVAAFLGVLLAGGSVVAINPARGDDRTRADIAALRLAVVVGEQGDLDTFIAPGSTTTVALAGTGAEPRVTPAPRSQREAEAYRPGVAVHMLTSGTTGPPKRIDLTYDMLAHSVLGPPNSRGTVPNARPRGVAIVNAPLVHIGGVFRVLQCVTAARSFVLLPRFELGSWTDAVRKYRPRTVSLVPAALRTVLHSDLSRDDLSSIRAVTSGTAPLSAEDADAFTDKFGIPVLTSYAATEFGGGVAGWTLADHREFWTAKRGSVGRADPTASLRVVDDDGRPLAADQPGLLEVRPGQLGPDADWIRTTDIARIDSDGFVWILGRADQAIIRGGFKILPDDVRSVLESHPAVAGAAVVGRNDERLGATPVAMIELRPAHETTPEALGDYLRSRLAGYEIPTEITIVDAIPRTPSGKADLTAVQAHFGAADRQHRGATGTRGEYVR
ncbi:fatty acid--CoA ligase family protein [Aldersonia sp. NBC_00410]|uniref:class I adenylate-forming enzyme family protein n=1 Tax=Aldersonia sp. NBC_00410 TaxID=2975954 RepID=UPI0022505A86|nr:fatty acid--CoA ligase family protein [Aldersonia sp. NBC_00410]MCX5045381.1 fatty acid--CoA ligase family protein [Aldersonia sp. NBC_00410]